MSVMTATHSIGGISFRVYKRSKEDGRSIGVLFLLHGRHGSADDVNQMAQTLVEKENEAKRLDLFVVTLDHRNHGARLVGPLANNTWKENNINHALDMYSIQRGTAQDVSFLMDFMQGYLFPVNERLIEAWGVAGISLGGHSTWIALGQDPRIKVGIPIIGCPDYAALLDYRAKRSNVPFAAPYIPLGFSEIIKSGNPASKDYTSSENTNPFLGKKILILSGEDDKLVPWVASQQFVETLEVGNEGVKEVFVQKGTGHKCTEEMIEKTARFIQAELLN